MQAVDLGFCWRGRGQWDPSAGQILCWSIGSKWEFFLGNGLVLSTLLVLDLMLCIRTSTCGSRSILSAGSLERSQIICVHSSGVSAIRTGLASHL